MIAVYPGTFDPVTLGHEDLIRRASALSEHLIVAVAAITGKSPLFDLEQRIALMQTSCQSFDNVTVTGFDGLLVDLVAKHRANVIVRGLRAVSDFEYEMQLAAVNRRLAPNIETLFMNPSEEHSFISSSIVRQIAAAGGDAGQFVSLHVALALGAKSPS